MWDARMPVVVTRWPTCVRAAGARLLSLRRAAQPRTRGRAMASQDASSPQFVPVSSRDDGFRVVSERVLHSRYVTLYDRTVEFPSDKKQQDAAPLRFDYDVLGHPRAGFHFVSIFPFHSAGDEPSCTVVREYGQGPNHLVLSLPAGAVDAKKHDSLQSAALAELSEECGLRGGTLVRLLPDGHPGLLETKWCRNRFTPFLCIDPEVDSAPGQLDAEEAVLTSHRLPLRQLMAMLYGDDMLLHSVATTHLAVRELVRRGLVDASVML